MAPSVARGKAPACHSNASQAKSNNRITCVRTGDKTESCGDDMNVWALVLQHGAAYAEEPDDGLELGQTE